MPNKNYLKGRRKEYKICSQYKQEGCDIAQRTAGSHSPFDVIAINSQKKKIFLIQCKPDNISEQQLRKIQEKNLELNGFFEVEFVVA